MPQKNIFNAAKKCNLCKENHFEVTYLYFCCNKDRQKYIDLTYLHAAGKGDFNLVKFLEKKKTKLRLNHIEPLKYLIRSGAICLIKKIIKKNAKKIDFDKMVNEACLSG